MITQRSFSREYLELQRMEKMIWLREELIAVEEDRLAGRAGCTLDELEAELETVIINAEKDGRFENR